MPLPPALEPLQNDRDQIVAILDRLSGPLEAVDRADLAGELVRFGARYQSVMDQAVYPMLREQFGDVPDLRRASDDGEALRESLAEVRRRTRHTKPINAHIDDPEGFDQALDELWRAASSSLVHEEEDLQPLVGRLDAAARDELHSRVDHAVAHASVHPNPPQNPIARAVVSIGEKIDRAVNDVSTTTHPAAEDVARHVRRARPADRAGTEKPGR